MDVEAGTRSKAAAEIITQLNGEIGESWPRNQYFSQNCQKQKREHRKKIPNEFRKKFWTKAILPHFSQGLDFAD